MLSLIGFVGPKHSVEVAGIRLVGMNAESGKKILLSLALVVVVYAITKLVRGVLRLLLSRRKDVRVRFWTRQGVSVIAAIALIIGLVSIWFDDPTKLSTAFGLVTAGLAFALQQVVTAVAGYIVILRGKTFNVGDRIRMGGVRGDVISLGFIQTTIMEMGQPPDVQSDDPAMWVKSRQYTGRIVTVSNSKIFDEPIYNYTRDLPYIWEETTLWVNYQADIAQAERILLEAANRHAVKPAEVEKEHVAELERRYATTLSDLAPKVYFRITSNWIELTVRFVTRAHGVREVKDAMSREIMAGFNEHGIGIASSTFDIVGLPPLRIESAETTPFHKRSA